MDLAFPLVQAGGGTARAANGSHDARKGLHLHRDDDEPTAAVRRHAVLCGKVLRRTRSYSDKGRGNIVIPDKKLVAWLLNVLAIELALCILYTVLHQNAGGVETVHSDEFLRTEVHCNETGFLSTLWSLNYAYFAVMICVLAYYSFKVRHVKQFSEAKCSFLSSFGILFIVLLMVVFAAVTDDVEHLVVINALAVCLALCEVGLFFWAPRIYKFHAHPDQRQLLGEVQRREHEQSQYAPSFFEKTDVPEQDKGNFRKMNTESTHDPEAAAADVKCEVTI